MLSPIQLKLLSKLTQTDKFKCYSEIYPRDINNDLFNYHLKYLVQKRYIIKEKKKYFLSDKGKKYVQEMDVLGNLKQYFKVSVICFAVDTKKHPKGILIQKRLRHPYFGDYLGISGKVLPGEKIEIAGKR